MKTVLYTTLLIQLLAGASAKGSFISIKTDTTVKWNNHSKKDTVTKMLQDYAQLGIPGLVIAVYTPSEGYWGAGSGFSEIETKTTMQPTNLQYLQSAAKMYMAAAILKLSEKGKINLDSPITKYLPARYSRYIDKAATMHVSNLLNHSSGMPDYLASPKYLTYVLQHPDHFFSSDELLGYIRNEKQMFIPGTKFDYSNSNYHVLALIADSLTGDHNEFIRKEILSPLGLTNTFYRNIAGHPALVKSYLDRFSTGIIENVTLLQQVSISFSKGDDGIIATPQDAISFLKGLMEGHLLTDSSLHQMLTFIKDPEGKPIYGMGIYYIKYGDHIGYGHGGAGAGAGCGLYYFPDKSLYVFLGTNIGTLVDGPITQKVNECKNSLLSVLLSD